MTISTGRAVTSLITFARLDRCRRFASVNSLMGSCRSLRSTRGSHPRVSEKSRHNRDVALRDFLLRLRDIWRRNFPEVPRLGRSDDTPQQSGIDKDLTEVLSMDGLSSSYSMRNLMGRHYLEHLWVFLSADFFVDAWNLPDIEPPPQEEPPEIDEPDRGLKTGAAMPLHQAAESIARSLLSRHSKPNRLLSRGSSPPDGPYSKANETRSPRGGPRRNG